MGPPDAKLTRSSGRRPELTESAPRQLPHHGGKPWLATQLLGKVPRASRARAASARSNSKEQFPGQPSRATAGASELSGRKRREYA